jgi:hypothetical protein
MVPVVEDGIIMVCMNIKQPAAQVASFLRHLALPRERYGGPLRVTVELDRIVEDGVLPLLLSAVESRGIELQTALVAAEPLGSS